MKRLLTLTLLSLSYSISAVSADYVLVLKNGRRINVQSYREEGSMIKFHGLGGEIAISKDQVTNILKDGDRGLPSLSLSGPDQSRSASVGEPTLEKQLSPPRRLDDVSASEEKLAEERAKEEKQYQKRIKEITEQIKQLREHYSAVTRGHAGQDPFFFTTEEAFRGHQEDLLSRLRDAQYKAQGLPTGRDAQSPPFSASPPPPYTEKQKELSDLRSRMNQLETERQRLIDEMKEKNFDTGSLFLE
jgi:hypothetical protein